MDLTEKIQLIFDKPSKTTSKTFEKFSEVLPIGNGRLGAMIGGGLQEKHIILNEETVWYGGPRDRNNPDAFQYMDKIRSMMREGNIREAERLALVALTGTPETQRHYSTLGMIFLEFLDDVGEVENYKRVLNFDSATVTESYVMNGVAYELTAFASHPDSVIAIRVCASEPVLRFIAGIERGERVGNFSYGTHMDESVRYAPNGLVMRGTCGGETGLRFRGALFGRGNGDTVIIGDKLVFDKASEVTLFVAAATNFEFEDIENICVKRCRDALEKGFEACRLDHIAEWSPLFNNTSIHLESAEAIESPFPMNKVFEAFEKNDLSVLGLSADDSQTLDDYLALLLFYFGRYLLLSSSRNCALPANLQGIWCRDLLSIWDGKFTTNINLQMAYWPTDSANLSICFEPYFQFAERIRKNGTISAKKMYGCRGFVLHNNTDIWADTAVQDAGAHCSYWFVGGVWIAVDMWEHYRYTLDLDFLEGAWPIMRDALLFVLDFMEESDGELVMGVTTSPESTYYTEFGEKVSFCRMSAMDSELISLLMKDCLEAMEVLQSSGRTDVEIPIGFEDEIKTAAKKLAPVRIGVDGAILEWGIEVEEGEPGHRHQSHVIGAYPYNEITENDTELFEAVRKSIEKRIRNGGGNTSFSLAWAAGLMARFGDGNTARDMVSGMARYSGLPNLFSCCNIKNTPKLMEDNMPMMIDGNLGAVQAVIEMLLQSHNGKIAILPALPTSWNKGNFSGLVARGNVVVDAWWDAGKLTHARLTPRVDGEVTLSTGEGYYLRSSEGMVINDTDGCIQARLSKDLAYVIEQKV
ncbi:MAG: glycoside hydrolase N-terminal domain-containing protein [Anaerolineaceae bacterium]|nr:glycoside hydrolase N-terminal domain-containing protein [Anaerolineaceae bacterium]